MGLREDLTASDYSPVIVLNPRFPLLRSGAPRPSCQGQSPAEEGTSSRHEALGTDTGLEKGRMIPPEVLSEASLAATPNEIACVW